MKSNHFTQMIQGVAALHQRTTEEDHARRARDHAEETDFAMRSAKPSGLLGDGRLADLTDIQTADLLDTEGLPVGAFEGKMLFYNGDGPIVTLLRTGGGKGVNYILPALAHVSRRSLFLTDLKDGENAYASAAHREQTLGTPCIFIDPYNERGLGTTLINPFQHLIEISQRNGIIDSDAVECAQTLLPPPAKQSENAWARSGGIRLLTALVEYKARFDPENCTPGGLWRAINGDKKHLDTTFALMATCGQESIERKAGTLSQTAVNAPKEFEAYKSEVIEALSSFEPGKALEKATSGHEFDFARLKEKPHTVYLILPASKIGVAAPFVTLILNHAIEAIAKARGSVRTTFLLDEFPQLPPSPVILKALRVYRAKGVQISIFAQGRFSMGGRWSQADVKEFEDQAALLILKNIQEPDVLRDVELWSGNRTVLMRGVSHNGGTVETAAANLGEAKRAVLQSEDIIGLGNSQQIIRMSGMKHLLVADAVPFFKVLPWRDQLKDVRDLNKGDAS